MSNKRYFFIINPKSGNGKGPLLIPEIESACKARKVNFTIQITQAAGEAAGIAKNAVNEGFDCIIAVGGDGTVNEVASSVNNTKAVLGIIPIGSGNGLAREMEISLAAKNALRTIFSGTIRKIDTGTCNGHFFACTAGVGFDAYMAHRFLQLKNRGLAGYVRLFIKDFFSYKEQDYTIITSEKTIQTRAFLITIANCRQWGNEFYISPGSNPEDGFFEICVIRKFPVFLIPVLLYRSITKTLHRSSYVMTIKASEIKIPLSPGVYFHRDGETSTSNGDLKIGLLIRSLAIITGK